MTQAHKRISGSGQRSAAHGHALRRVETWLRLEQERRQLTGEAGRLDQVIEWGGGYFRYTYDPQGDLTAIVEAKEARQINVAISPITV